MSARPIRDAETTVAQLRRIVDAFVAERDWGQFHTPKNLAMSLAIEAAELMEHFQWLTPEQSWQAAADAEKKRAIGEELSDVFGYLLALAGALELDLASALVAKMAKNAEKYPIERYRGLFGPADPNRP
ncbi:MAG: nucleotide pyrophosphohydrolase [Pirellulaceae bacterium]|jgi:NTP pyrophosphatase (non-canonical NTP hydrolase)|nr:nucleotide pyrophosphohydrolase [Thermoguttaceae bacterium]MDI9446476.1 nucleotide pyrophosphohydrolase [Planctomycetota bacterium]NLZ00231.1 nucleotide pyrophosphohydrolase [Pirellulaceae bacterium]